MISAFQTHLEKGRVIWDLELLLSVRFPVEIFKLLFQRFGDAWFTFNCILCIWVFYLVLVVPSEAREGVGSFGSGSTGGCELQCGCRGWNLLGHLEEHGLTVKPWIWPNIYFYQLNNNIPFICLPLAILCSHVTFTFRGWIGTGSQLCMALAGLERTEIYILATGRLGFQIAHPCLGG